MHWLIPLEIIGEYTVDFAIVFVELRELNRVGVVLINKLETKAYFIVRDLNGSTTQFFHKQCELIKSQSSLFFVEIIKHFLKCQLVSSYQFVEFSKAAFDFGTDLRRYAVKCFSVFPLKNRHRLELSVEFDAV